HHTPQNFLFAIVSILTLWPYTADKLVALLCFLLSVVRLGLTLFKLFTHQSQYHESSLFILVSSLAGFDFFFSIECPNTHKGGMEYQVHQPDRLAAHPFAWVYYRQHK